MKRLLCLLLSIAVCLGAMTFAPVQAGVFYGDLNQDGVINSRDARVMMTMISRGADFGDLSDIADVNGDGNRTTADVRLILAAATAPRTDAFPLSGVTDSAGANGTYTITMYAEYDDTYMFSCTAAASLSVGGVRGATVGTTSVSKAISAGEYVTVTLKFSSPGTSFILNVIPQVHKKRLPYLPDIRTDASTLDVYGNSNTDPLTYAPLSYSKREGGTYIYANNPEKLQSTDIGQALLRNEGLKGHVEFTYEHSNATGRSVYLGYQVKNTGSSDVYVTVLNIGNQVKGEWLGQQSWSQYYNRFFALPSDYFDAYGNESARYEGQDFLNYTPRVYQPMTYRIPAGKHIYVLGGTTWDAYNHIDVASTANMSIANGRCANGVVKFFVSGGEVTGTFYCYTQSSQVLAEPKEQGFITERDGVQYGLQYKGVDYHQGLLESELVWYVNDSTPSQDLPVTYKTAFDSSAYYNYDAYEAFSKINTYTRYQRYWTTNINPQERSNGIGSDMMSFECVTTDGKTVVIDTEHADSTGKPANLGNWMVDYHDNLTFVNQGSETRYFTINKYANGALMTMVLDDQGEVLTTKCTIVPISESADERQWELYTVAVPPHSVKQVTVSFLLMGNSYGNVRNWVTLE